jgi:hypothetical protein
VESHDGNDNFTVEIFPSAITRKVEKCLPIAEVWELEILRDANQMVLVENGNFRI